MLKERLLGWTSEGNVVLGSFNWEPSWKYDCPYLSIIDALRRTTTGMFISTQHNMVYGFDADSIGSAPLWSRSLGTSTNANDISTVRYCSDIPYEEARPGQGSRVKNPSA